MDSEAARKETTFGGASHPWKWLLAFPLGFMMFFYLGWTYQASWYWYYGLSPDRLNVPLSDILQQSITLSLLVLGVLLGVFGILFLLRLIVLCLWNVFSRDRRIEPASLFSFRDLFQRHIHFVLLTYVALIYEFRAQVSAHNPGFSDLEIPANLAMLEIFIIPAAFILLLRLSGDLLSILPANFKQRLRLASEAWIHDGPYRLVLGILSVFAASVIFTGITAVGDASIGYRENASYQAVRQVYLESHLPVAGLERYLRCNCSPYVYGPMGYLGSNQEYLFLVPWKADGQTEFPQFPSLYQIERSSANPINIVPDGLNPQWGQESQTSTIWEQQTKSP